MKLKPTLIITMPSRTGFGTQHTRRRVRPVAPGNNQSMPVATRSYAMTGHK